MQLFMRTILIALLVAVPYAHGAEMDSTKTTMAKRIVPCVTGCSGALIRVCANCMNAAQIVVKPVSTTEIVKGDFPIRRSERRNYTYSSLQ